MKNFSKLFKIKKNRLIPVDKFIEKVLYKPKIGYYSKKNPFGRKGDFITAPTISNLFSEIIGIWIISSWEKLGKPKKFNIFLTEIFYFKRMKSFIKICSSFIPS